MAKLIITPSMFYQYAACPHWIWYDKFGDQTKKGETPELAQKLLELGVAHEEEYIKGMNVQPVLTRDQDRAAAQTLELMEQGVPLIYQGTIQAEMNGTLWCGRPDLLQKVPGSSKFGDWLYVPCDIKSSHSIHDTQALQLGFYALVLEQVQGTFSSEASIINVDHQRIPLDLDQTLLNDVRETSQEILEILNGQKPPLRLSSKCKQSPWFKECVRAAEEAQDIALIYGADNRAMEALRAEGIHTLKDTATMQPARLPKIPYAPLPTLQRLKLQAQSLLDKKLVWLKKPALPNVPLKIYFDIEGDPLLDVEYLFGFWMVGDTDRRYAKHGQVRDTRTRDPLLSKEGRGVVSGEADDGYYLYFMAEKPEDQKRMWKEFLSWTDCLPKDGFAVFHYADYERARTLRLAEEFGSSPGFKRFAQNYVDVFTVVKSSVIFPLYFYSIKDIAKSSFLDFHWRHKKAGGAQSIFWYEEWLETNDRAILNDIIDYNEDDVIATEYLCRWLREKGT